MITCAPLRTADGQELYVIYVHPYQADVLRLLRQMEGRDPRRIKRELRKLELSYRRKTV